MNVLIVGSGGREHALAWKLAQSPLLTSLHAAPGNPGIARHARCHPVKTEDVAGLVALARRESIALVVVGPEAPLVAGLADQLRAAGIAVFGPGAEAARIEGSKAFSKEVMAAANVPTAAFETFDDPAAAEDFAARLGRAVVKADGLAAGKGVIVAADERESREAVRAIMGAGGPGRRVVIEEFLEGEEVSVIALCDGERYLLLPPAQDHKRLLDGDRGPNTGGMGAYSPAPVLDPARHEEIGRSIIGPTLKALADRGTPFVGALIAGLMMTPRGPMTLEFNCRFGDPETQPLMMRLGGDLLPVLAAAAKGDLRGQQLEVLPAAAIGVVLASHGYPTSPRTGDVIEGLGAPASPDVQLFHAGTREQDGRIVTAGGRVLTVCARGADVAQARERAYGAIRHLHFEGMQFRTDIAHRALARG